MSDKRYNVITADPPWAYTDHNTGGSMKSGSSHHYATMTPATVARMRVSEICCKDAVLFLWATTPLLPEIFPVMNAWGFEYKTMITWYKVDRKTMRGRLGLGHYFRGMTEHCLVGVRGYVKPLGCQMENVIIEKPREHSRKPDGFWNLISYALREKGLDNRIELFCRGEPHISEGFGYDPVAWDGWGFQCEGKRKVEFDMFFEKM
jgi:N6-adenosine-specific RNA methylase IME4